MTTSTTSTTHYMRTIRTQPAYATLVIQPTSTTVWTYNPVTHSGLIPSRRTP